MNTREHFDSMLTSLHNDLLKMVTIVEDRINESIDIFKSRDLSKIADFVNKDDIIDKMEVEIQEKSIKIIATQQPTAKDLREIITTLNIVTEVERIGDYATDIAKIVKRLKETPNAEGTEKIFKMVDKVTDFLKASIDCFIKRDNIEALKLVVMDDEVDASYKHILLWAMQEMRNNGDNIEEVLHLIFITKYLERIADRATNICELAIFLTTGEHKDLNN